MTAERLSLYGDETEAFGANPADMDRTYQFRYRVINLPDLIASHSDNLQANPEYPQELQPRIRDRAASRIQVETMASRLNPRALLHDSGFIDTGPMITGPDSVVESGNGRVLALRMAVSEFPERYDLYRSMLIKNADKYGINPDAVSGITTPVLVRERLTKVDRVQFAAEANVGAVMGMSPYEQALQDSGRLSENIVSTLQVGEDQTIDQSLRTRANAHIVSHFISTIAPSDRATIAEAKGAINQQGLDRLKLAIFAKTYTGDAGQRLVRIFGENVDPVIKSVENAMFQSLPDMAKAESLIDAGYRDKSLSISEDLAEVIDTYASLKQSGLTISDYLAQQAMFEERLTPFQKQLLEHFEDISRKPKLVREFLREIAGKIEASPPPGQVSMLGEVKLSKEDIVNVVVNSQRADAGKPPVTITTAIPESAELAKPDTGRIEEASGVGIGMGRGRPETDAVAEQRPDSVMVTGASVQTGLEGMGKEAAQVEMLGEYGTAPGAGGRLDPFVDPEAIKAREAAKPLPGQIGLVEAKPEVSQLQTIHDDRSDQSRRMDESQKHSVVIQPNDPRVERWKKNQGIADIQGIDTPRRGRKARLKRKKKKRTSKGGVMIFTRIKM